MTSKRYKPNAAIRLYARLGVDTHELFQLSRRDSSVGAEPAGTGQRRTARQHALLNKAGTRRKFTKPEHTTTVWGAIEGQRKQLRGSVSL